MFDTQLLHGSADTTSRIMRLVLDGLSASPGRDFTSGMPAGSMCLDAAGLIVGGTPCEVPMFRFAMVRAALSMSIDVLVARHGAYPEVLNPVLWDAVVWQGHDFIPVNDLILYVGHDDRYWLVPAGNGPHLALTAKGLHLTTEPPFLTWQQRSEGVCEAARRIIRATRGGEER